jgi:ADP-ribosylglycohydrolase
MTDGTRVLAPLERAQISLEGLAFGDAFGDRFFIRSNLVEQFIAERALPGPPWRYTDDTQMALSVVGALARFESIDQNWLASSFAEQYDFSRGYGPAMHGLLGRIRDGADWREAAGRLFSGQGSHGNGAAMRVAPLGAYFADDLNAVATQAARSAEVTHAHPEGIIGAIAVAQAAAWASRLAGTQPVPTRAEFLDLVLAGLPSSDVRGGIVRAIHLGADASVRLAVAALGNGEGLSAQDTVPFALWCAAGHLDNLEDAFWTTLSGLGDRDTTCAIVGGIVAVRTGVRDLPTEWHASRESLPRWPFQGTAAHDAIS